MEPCIEIRSLSKSFGSKHAVDRLTLDVPRGAIFALLGDNGAGKTTTIRMLLGLLKPDGGRAAILGQDCWSAAARLRHRVGYVPERPRYYDWMTVRETGWFSSGFQGPGYLSRFEGIAARFELEPEAKLKNLSKGQYSKVALALALAADPEVLILDEPTSGLDLLVRRQFLESMVGLAGEGKTVLISSHQIAEVERIASHVAFLARGRLVLSAAMEELKRRIVRFRLRFEQHPPPLEGLGTILRRNGSGKLWQAVVQDPNWKAVETLRSSQGIFDFEEAAIGLEELYTALMGPRELAP